MRRVRSWLYTCAVPVSALCTNAQLPSFGGDLLPERTVFVRAPTQLLLHNSTVVYSRSIHVCYGCILLYYYAIATMQVLVQRQSSPAVSLLRKRATAHQCTGLIPEPRMYIATIGHASSSTSFGPNVRLCSPRYTNGTQVLEQFTVYILDTN